MICTRKFLSGLGLMLAMCHSAFAATLTAGNEAQLDSALAAAAPGDTISILGDIVVTGEKALNKNLTIEGNGYTISVPQPGLDAAGLANPVASPHRVFRALDVPVSIEIRNLTIIGGKAEGAGIKVAEQASVSLTEVTV